MAGWDRYGEEKKYRKDVDINDNPKHVGEPLRKLTLEDRLELRRQTREQQKKRTVQAEIEEELSDEELIPASPSKRPKKGRPHGATNGEDAELDIIAVANGKSGKSKEIVDLADEDGATSSRAALRRARRRAKAKAKGKPQPSEVEVLE
ncbi:unnamed protein product [Durusdinium trenchii]|uniref:Uncharacterized protein n=2 Tax=Durusdinium trenchii TaxID=1381693 RepID=A0ABP0JZV3_9DINO